MKNREYYNKAERERYHKNRVYINARKRKIRALKKALALQATKNDAYKAPKPKILTSVPTYPLTHLLYFLLFYKSQEFAPLVKKIFELNVNF